MMYVIFSMLCFSAILSLNWILLVVWDSFSETKLKECTDYLRQKIICWKIATKFKKYFLIFYESKGVHFSLYYEKRVRSPWPYCMQFLWQRYYWGINFRTTRAGTKGKFLHSMFPWSVQNWLVLKMTYSSSAQDLQLFYSTTFFKPLNRK